MWALILLSSWDKELLWELNVCWNVFEENLAWLGNDFGALWSSRCVTKYSFQGGRNVRKIVEEIRLKMMYLEKQYLTHLALLRNHFCALWCSRCVSLLVEGIFFFFQGNIEVVVGKILLKSQRNALTNVREILLRKILRRHLVSAQLLRQSPISQFYGKGRNWWRGEQLEKIFQEIIFFIRELPP